jgi:hypothetical protein
MDQGFPWEKLGLPKCLVEFTDFLFQHTSDHPYLIRPL